MNFYFLLYIFVIIYCLIIGFLVFKKLKNKSGLFFINFTIFLSLWFFLYFISYFAIKDGDLLLFLIKLMYLSSIIGIYSFIFFIKYYTIKKSKKIDKKSFFIYLIFLLITFLYLFTDSIIDGIYFNDIKNDYYERLGNLNFIHIFLSIVSIPSLFYVGFRKIKELVLIERLRLFYILLGFIILIFLGLFFQLLLPLFGIYILEKEVVLFVIPFLILTGYSISRYNFIDYSLKYRNIFSFFFSIFATVIIFLFIKKFSLSLGEMFNKYWEIEKSFSYVDLIFGIIIYLILYNFFLYLIPGNSEYKKFENEIKKIKDRIPFIKNIEELNNFLSKKVKSKFNIKYININLIEDFKNNLIELCGFFNSMNSNVFINDLVFIEENKNKFNKKNIQKELNKNTYLIFPIYSNNRKLIGLFELGHKPFKEQYYYEELKIIESFVQFLSGHIKYLEIYSSVNDLNINLDKKVDEKTIEYNNLISKQREFISVSSHEIKTPIMGSVLQVESIINDIKEGNNLKYIKNEINILKQQIFKVADLVKKIFSVQKYDINTTSLYLEKIRFKDLIYGEYNILSNIYKNIIFDIEIDERIGFIDIDKVQFTQVISNLFNNAIKFCDKENPKILCKVKLIGNYINMSIEDNGKGFKNIEKYNVFEKYFTGKSNSIGIGLGLYLCKKIIELHKGNISVKISKKLGGAKFILSFPRNLNEYINNGGGYISSKSN